ncbi:MAG: hypothetical protein J6R47_06030 [Acholeplasmatales bacterium]|nr:hypothetical protein [Acholeplasmatales bacterium]
MLENFNITATKLKRLLKVSVYLPRNYNNTLEPLDSVFLLDGQNVFHDVHADNEKSMQLGNFLEEENINKIVFAIHAPKNPDWRLSEFIPFNLENPNLDHSLSIRFKEYILEELIPLLETKYRLNQNKAIIGFKESAYTSLFIGNDSETFKLIGVFSPIYINNKDEYLNLINNKMIYLYAGGTDNDEIDELSYSIYQHSYKNNFDNFIFDYEAEKTNTIVDWPYHIIKLIKTL